MEKVNKTDRLVMLMDEISIAKGKLQPQDTGHIHTSISYLESRVDELKNEIYNDLRKAAYAY